MTLATDVESMYKHIKGTYDAISALGGTLPNNKNLENLSDTIATLPLLPPYDPANPTLDGLKAAINAGDYAAFPAGTEIPDTYDGQSNPLIVAQYLDSSNNSTYGGAEGVILVRKYVEPISQQYGSNINYTDASGIKPWLDSTYLDNCSNELKTLISNIQIPRWTGTGAPYISCQWFLMSALEIGLATNSNYSEGFFWDYWKQKTGLVSPSDNNLSGRIVTSRDGTPRQFWTRTYLIQSGVDYIICVTTTGGQGKHIPTAGDGVLPACFIAKDPVEPTSLDNLKKAIDAGETIKVGTEIPDTYNGIDNPWIVGQQLTSANNSSYGGAEGVLLFRKYVDPAAMALGTADTENYPASTINTYLNSTYLENCSDGVKNNISTISLPCYEGSAISQLDTKMFLMSDIELGDTKMPGEGVLWDYWQEQLDALGWGGEPGDWNVPGRKATTPQGVEKEYWTRSQRSVSRPDLRLAVDGNGGLSGAYSATTSLGVRPACFIGKTQTEPEFEEVDLSQPLNEAGYENLSNIVKAGKASEYLNLGDELLVPYDTYTMPSKS